MTFPDKWLDWLEPEMRAAIEKMTEPQIVTLVLFGEARSEPIEGIVAVGCVLRNRAHADGRYGKTYAEVATKRLQFSCLSPLGGKSNYKRVIKAAQLLAGGQPVTDVKVRECAWVAHGVIGDYARDVTNGSTHYHVATMTPRPAWAQDHVPTKQIGSHVFYSGIK